ncbi:hypothetical protein [Streptomyces sp. NPDC092952]|uniref:hypothetical protein n=1 Tax=Streptomyces sp. NPDC092952 TaxID=3366018 RepID=UPI003827776C
MNTPRPHLKSLPPPPTGPHPAEPAPAPTGSGAPKDVGRQAVPVAVRSDPHTVTVTGIQPGLTVRGLGRHQIPTADWLCGCGRHERARGGNAVTNLTARARIGHCPHTEPAANRSAA